MTTEDPRCCGTGTCLINAQGVCWCGQQWNGTQMCFPAPNHQPADPAPATPTDEQAADKPAQ